MVAPLSGKIDLHGQVAIVTGASGGIGRSVALTLAREGADLIVSDVVETKETENLIKELGREVLGVQCDVSQKNQVTELVQQAVNRFGKVEILVNCAGICHRGGFEDISVEDWDRELNINVRGTFLMVQAVMPVMKKQKYGKIVCFGSVAGKGGGTVVGPQYVASKGAVHAFIKWAAKEAAADSVYVNCVAPGPVRTRMIEGYKEYHDGMTPLKRLGQGEDVAEAVLFLASQASNWITGEVLNVNGGILMD